MTEKRDGECSFKWGEMGVKGKGGVQFYKSFTYEGIEYFLYDCVYLYAEDEPEPYIGKLVKIWGREDGDKKVKVVWFFRPFEVVNYLQTDVQDKEIFLASGEGAGLFNVNHLEAINGKCNVVCTMKDKRNPQPSAEELKRADYFFSCTFDVGKLRIVDDIGDTVADIDVVHFFNRRTCEELINIPSLQKSSTYNRKKSGLSRSNSVQAIVNEVKDRSTSFITGEEAEKSRDEGKECRSFSGETALSQVNSGFSKDVVKDEKNLTKHVHNKVKFRLVRNSKCWGVSQNISFKRSGHLSGPDKKPGLSRSVSESSNIHGSGYKRERMEDLNEEKKIKVCHGEKTEGGLSRSVSVKSNIDWSGYERERTEDLYEEKKKKVCHGEKTEGGLSRSVSEKSNIDGSGHKRERMEDLHEEKKKKAWHGEKTEGIGTDRQNLEERSKWFKSMPWEERLQAAYDKETLILFDNLDPSYTSEEVKDIVRQAFGLDCTVKVIPRNSFSCPHSGQAFAIFKSKEVAEGVIDRLQRECLMLDDNRPLVAVHPEPLGAPQRGRKLIGHLSIDKILHRQGSEKSKAVSTSHFPQANTIEFDMAVEWVKLQKQSDLWWKELHTRHLKELDHLKRKLNHNLGPT